MPSVDGFIVKVYDNSTGSLVRKDEPLATYYNRDLPTTLQTYYYALALDRLQQDQKLFVGQSRPSGRLRNDRLNGSPDEPGHGPAADR